MLPLAVHISSGIIEPEWQAVGFVAMAAAVALALWKLDERDIPRIGVLTAAFFVASSFHLPVLVISVHLLLNGLVGIILRRRASIAIAVGLAMQCLLFGHGGPDALGVNFCVLAIPAWLAGWLFCIVRRWLRPGFGLGLALGVFCAGLTVLLHVSVLFFFGRGDWAALAATSLVAHIPVIAVEGVGVGFAMKVLAKGKPEWLGVQPSEGKISSNGTSH